ncbi:permease-like cell division protein FtsX [Candidatus Dojkabacteria bacterium]|jgi:cell division transport system permease protein|nr:permease-like cell division protein FtsX [Candidatus Dojkabacteria bacterium]
MENISKFVKATRDNITRNKWLSLSTIFVISIVFTLSTLFITLGVIGQKAVKYYETKAQVIVFFKQETPEAEIFKFRDKIDDANLVSNIEYISKEKALEQYKTDFVNDPDLVDTLSTDTLPPSLGIKAKSAQALEDIIKNINVEKEKNAYVDDVMYFKDVVAILKTLSTGFNIGISVLIFGLTAITFSLIMITIGFNILSHKDDIEIMNLMGSPEQYIKVPYLLEGAIYGIIGAIASTSLILVPWYILIIATRNTDFHFWISGLLNELGLSFLTSFNPLFIIVSYCILIVIGTVFGVLSSYFAVLKYLNLKEK